MNYYIAIEPKDAENPDYGAMIPDFEGCTAQAKTMEKLMTDIAGAGEQWAKIAWENNIPIPEPSDYETLKKNHPDLDSFVLGVIDLNLKKFQTRAERINITLPGNVLKRLDRLAKDAGETRSGYIAKLVKEA